MGSKLYCHIGMQKAGSKAIQHFSATNARALIARGFRYPRNLCKGVWHRDVFSNYSALIDERIGKHCQRPQSVVLSFERAYDAPDELIERLSGHADELHVLLVVREPVSWVNSWMNQIAKAHRSPYVHFEDFYPDAPNIAKLLDVDTHLSRWEAFTAADRIKVVEYDPKGDVVDPYLAWLGIDRDGKGFEEVEGDPNKALDEASIRVFLEVKRRSEQLDRLALSKVMRRAHQRLRSEGTLAPSKEPFRLVDDEMAARILERYQPAVERAMARYGGGQPTRFDATREALLSRRVMSDFEPRPEESALAAEIVDDTLATVPARRRARV